MRCFSALALLNVTGWGSGTDSSRATRGLLHLGYRMLFAASPLNLSWFYVASFVPMRVTRLPCRSHFTTGGHDTAGFQIWLHSDASASAGKLLTINVNFVQYLGDK